MNLAAWQKTAAAMHPLGQTRLAQPARSQTAGAWDIRLVHAVKAAPDAGAGQEALGRRTESGGPDAVPAPKETLTAARDIRLIYAAPGAAEALAPAPGTEQGRDEQGKPAGWQEEQPGLVLARPAPAQEQAPGQQSLPDWARKLLAKDQASPKVHGAGGQAGQIQWTAPYARPRTGPAAGLSSAAELPSPLLYHRQDGESDEQKARRQAEKDAEIRRTADKVYRIIEERLRRELRRSGR